MRGCETSEKTCRFFVLFFILQQSWFARLAIWQSTDSLIRQITANKRQTTCHLTHAEAFRKARLDSGYLRDTPIVVTFLAFFLFFRFALTDV